MTLTLLTSCGDKKSDVGGLGDDNKINNVFNQGKNNKSTLQLETYTGDGFSILVPKGSNIMTGGDGIYF